MLARRSAEREGAACAGACLMSKEDYTPNADADCEARIPRSTETRIGRITRINQKRGFSRITPWTRISRITRINQRTRSCANRHGRGFRGSPGTRIRGSRGSPETRICADRQGRGFRGSRELPGTRIPRITRITRNADSADHADYQKRGFARITRDADSADHADQPDKRGFAHHADHDDADGAGYADQWDTARPETGNPCAGVGV